MVLSLAPNRRSSGFMNVKQSSEKTMEAKAAIVIVQEATFPASDSSFRPSSRTIRLPPPTPNRFASAPAIRKTVSTSEDAATI